MIKITEKYYIKPEDCQYTVIAKKTNSKSGKDTYKALSYHSDFTSAVQKVMQLTQSNKLAEHDMNLFEAVEILKETNADFKKMMEVFKQVHEVL